MIAIVEKRKWRVRGRHRVFEVSRQAQEGAGGLTLRTPHETRLHCGGAGRLCAII